MVLQPRIRGPGVRAATALLACALSAALAEGIPPIPVPPDRDARRAQLAAFQGGCGKPSPTVKTAAQESFALGAIGRGEAPYLEEWVSARAATV
jgi:hypothetical protein